MDLGYYLKESREKTQKSVYDVEKETKINHGSIYRWEKNENEPTISQCIKLADCYGITIDELIGRDFIHVETHKTHINNSFNNNSGNINFKG